MRSLIPVPTFGSAALIVIVYLGSFVVGNAIAPRIHDSRFLSQIDLPELHRLDSRNPHSAEPKPLAQRHADFLRILLHNGLALLTTTALGLCLFFFPAIQNSFLGLLCGVFYWYVNSPMLYARLMLPHGVVELPTSLYVAAVAQSCGWKWLRAGAGKRKREFMNQSGMAGRCFLVAIPFIVIAAIIEAYVT